MEMILGSQKRFLCNYRIPAQLRVKVLESVVLTSGLYGAEVWVCARVKVLESVVLTSGLYGAEVWVCAETRTTHRRYKRSYTKV